ncbi:lysozyme [Paraherbaspirillum soli]|uniref:Lysozyme n=1 Tax=Paraherbaspirillum soli TaxID=631222 RepID=A0ABW0MAW5_9BURK
MAEQKDKPNTGFLMSAKGRLRLASRERLVLAYYNDGGKNKGHCTYGYGTLVHRGVCTKEEMKLPVSLAKAEVKLNSGIRDAESAIKRNLTYPLNQDQFDALVSLTYNAGPTGAGKVFLSLNEGKLQAAIDKIKKMIYATQNGKKVAMRGLINRREEESAPFEAALKEAVND